MDLLKAIDAKNKFRDPIFGYIWLTDDEVEIVDTPIFQRLRRIQQLALTKYVFPTAEHSRFVHSLGVLQSATNIFYELWRKNRETLLQIIKSDELNKFFKTLRFAALLHDIGHLPFSHACEFLLPNGITHEHISQYIVLKHPTIKAVLKRNSVQPEIVAALYKGLFGAKYNIIKKVISGIFDADRADYLLRDSYNCGVTYGNYDYIRYVSSFNLTRTNTKDDIALTIEEGNIQVLESFLLARYHYNMQVPYHRTRTGLDRTLEIYGSCLRSDKRLPDLKIKIDPPGSIGELDLKRFTFFDDYEIFELIKSDYNAGNIWARILLREDHLSPIFDRTGIDKEDLIFYGEYILMLQDEGLKENEHFITYRHDLKIHELISGSDERKNNDGIKIKDKRGEIIGSFIDRSPVIKFLQEKTVHLLRVYILSDQRDKAIQILKRLYKRTEERKRII